MGKTKLESGYLASIREQSDNLRFVMNDLCRMASAFHTVGNEKVSDRLDEYAETIDAAIKEINDAVGREINKSLDQSRSMTGNIISSVFAGMELERRALKESKKESANV